MKELFSFDSKTFEKIIIFFNFFIKLEIIMKKFEQMKSNIKDQISHKYQLKNQIWY